MTYQEIKDEIILILEKEKDNLSTYDKMKKVLNEDEVKIVSEFLETEKSSDQFLNELSLIFDNVNIKDSHTSIKDVLSVYKTSLRKLIISGQVWSPEMK